MRVLFFMDHRKDIASLTGDGAEMRQFVKVSVLVSSVFHSVKFSLAD